jgi:hypothetical protein
MFSVIEHLDGISLSNQSSIERDASYKRRYANDSADLGVMGYCSTRQGRIRLPKGFLDGLNSTSCLSDIVICHPMVSHGEC